MVIDGTMTMGEIVYFKRISLDAHGSLRIMGMAYERCTAVFTSIGRIHTTISMTGCKMPENPIPREKMRGEVTLTMFLTMRMMRTF